MKRGSILLKVTKFGGSSMADAGQYQKVRSILLADPARKVVIVSAAGKRDKKDHKITDLLYLSFAHSQYGVGEITEGYARAALCQMDELHYIVVAANTTGMYQEIPTVKQFRKNIMATGCRMAYCLDGGQTATIVMNDELRNRPVYGQQRKISDIIYFATAVPDGGGDNG